MSNGIGDKTISPVSEEVHIDSLTEVSILYWNLIWEDTLLNVDMHLLYDCGHT